METKKEIINSKVKTLGTINIVVGILSIFSTVIMAILGIAFLLLSSLPNAGEDKSILVIYGVILLVFSPIALIISILDIVAGVKLRKPLKNPKGWIIYTIVVGALALTSITGILQLIFGILAITSLHESEHKTQ